MPVILVALAMLVFVCVPFGALFNVSGVERIKEGRIEK